MAFFLFLIYVLVLKSKKKNYIIINKENFKELDDDQ